MEIQEQRQQHFTKIWKHFITDGARPGIISLGNLTCAYRGALGSKCALGVLLTDEEARQLGSNTVSRLSTHDLRYLVDEDVFHPNIDHMKIRSDVKVQVPEFVRNDVPFYIRVQYMHDWSTSRAVKVARPGLNEIDEELFLTVFKEAYEGKLRLIADYYGLTVPVAA